jgi:3-hydroxyisobutyrate dehydrogenase-like beta-hydroxyacid dehydrogenase
MRVGFIGFGEAARAFHASLSATDPSLTFAAYDVLLDGAGPEGACARAMCERDVAISSPPEGRLRDADWVFSAVTADQSLQAAIAAAAWLRPGQVFFDINSVSPDRKRESAGAVASAGASYVDTAVMAPVHPKGHRTAILLAGQGADAVADRLKALKFDFEIVGPHAGAATAVKMVRSVFVKGLEAVTVETMLAASASGCLDRVLGSLQKTYPTFNLPELARYQLERTTRHGKRRAAEMRESAATLDSLRLHGRLAQVIAEVQDRMGELPAADVETGDLAEVLERLVALRRDA